MRKTILFVLVAALVFSSAACRKDRIAVSKADPAPQPTITTPVNAGGPSAFPQDKPILSCRVENVSLYPVPNKPEDLAISLVASVENSGAPSTVQGWKLTVQSPNRSDYGALAPVHVNGVVDMPGKKAMRVDLSKDDLAVKGKATKVTRFAPVKGVLTFILPKTSVADVSNNQSSFVVHFEDSQDGLYRSARTFIGGKSNQ